jgi:hypothetical protein
VITEGEGECGWDKRGREGGEGRGRKKKGRMEQDVGKRDDCHTREEEREKMS